MSYYGGTIELESAEWNDKKAVEHELAQAAWGMRLNVWYDLFQWNKNIVCADKRAAINKLASMPDWNGVLYHMDVPDTAAIKRLAAAERKAEERYREVCAATDIHNRKSKTITCKACGSRVELARFKGSVCPVCKKSLRSESARERVDRAKKAHEAAVERLAAARTGECPQARRIGMDGVVRRTVLTTARARARVVHRPRFSGRMNGSAKGTALGEESRSPKNDELEQSGHEHGARHGPDERLQPRRARGA